MFQVSISPHGLWRSYQTEGLVTLSSMTIQPVQKRVSLVGIIQQAQGSAIQTEKALALRFSERTLLPLL